MTPTPPDNKTLLDAVKAARSYMEFGADYPRVRDQLDAAIEAAEPKPVKRDRGMEMAREHVKPYGNCGGGVVLGGNWIVTMSPLSADEATEKLRADYAKFANARAEEVKAEAVEKAMALWPTPIHGSKVATLVERIKAL